MLVAFDQPVLNNLNNQVKKNLIVFYKTTNRFPKLIYKNIKVLKILRQNFTIEIKSGKFRRLLKSTTKWKKTTEVQEKKLCKMIVRVCPGK